MVMDPLTNKAAFSGLRQYVKELDSNTLPPFLARVCDPVKPCSFSEEEMLCIFETAAQAHGRKIVPHIALIVSAIVRMMSSRNAVGCSKVVCALSRYVVDPLATEALKSAIIGSLCRPFADCLMSTKVESNSFGSALCVAALVQSNNWRFASNELVNDVCLKVSGALEEAHAQSIAHLNLVVVLLTQNPLMLEPYGRSLIRSGLQILDESAKASSSQMIISSIQMIHSIMKGLDLGIISSEISSIIHAMEQFQDDTMPAISIAAFEASETAKLLVGRQKESGHDNNLSQLANYSVRNGRKGSYSHSLMDDADIRDNGSCDSHSCDLNSVHLSTDFDSQHSVGQCGFGSTRARRRLWCNKSDKSHGMSNHDLFRTVIPDSHEASGLMAHFSSVDPIKPDRRLSDVPTRVAGPCYVCSAAHETNHCSQISRAQVLSGDMRMNSTPRKQLHSCTFCRDPEQDGHPPLESPAIQHCSGPGTNILQFRKNSELKERKEFWDSIRQENQCHMQNTDALIEDLKFPADDDDEDFDGAAKSPCQECQAVNEKKTGGKKRNANRSHYPVFLFVFVVAIIALFFPWWKDYKEPYVVPT
uniref:TORTIFOLIA1/SINE1-2 N-terminal domain-containing protein n=1 Tax=Oryza nivara TaxID=4536 RepID=A0A0E0JCN6_ORYNI